MGVGARLPSQDIRSRSVKCRDTTQKAQPYVPANKSAFQAHPPHQPSPVPLKQPPRLPTACAPHHWLLQRLELCPRSGEAAVVLGGRATRPSGRPQPMGIQARQEKGGARSSRKQRLGGGRGVSSCYTFCESGAHGRKRKQPRPTHPLTHECDYSTRFNRGLRTHKRKHTPIVFSTWRDAFKASASRSHRSIFPDLFTSMQEAQRKGCGGRTRVGNAKPTNYNAPKVRLWPFDQRERARLTRRRHI